MRLAQGYEDIEEAVRAQWTSPSELFALKLKVTAPYPMSRAFTCKSRPMCRIGVFIPKLPSFGIPPSVSTSSLVLLSPAS